MALGNDVYFMMIDFPYLCFQQYNWFSASIKPMITCLVCSCKLQVSHGIKKNYRLLWVSENSLLHFLIESAEILLDKIRYLNSLIARHDTKAKTKVNDRMKVRKEVLTIANSMPRSGYSALHRVNTN